MRRKDGFHYLDATAANEIGISMEELAAIRETRLKEGEHFRRMENGRVLYSYAGVLEAASAAGTETDTEKKEAGRAGEPLPPTDLAETADDAPDAQDDRQGVSGCEDTPPTQPTSHAPGQAAPERKTARFRIHRLCPNPTFVMGKFEGDTYLSICRVKCNRNMRKGMELPGLLPDGSGRWMFKGRCPR
jgi:hypothetical protein